MKTLQFITILLIGMFLGMGTMNAQNCGPCANCPMGSQASKNAKLNLTEDQQTQMNVLRETFFNEMKAVREDESLSTAEKKAKFDALRDDHHTKMMALLTDEQKEIFKSNSGPGHGHGYGMGKYGPGPKGANSDNDEFKALLKEKRVEFDQNLSDAEKATIAEIRVKMQQHWEDMNNLKPGEMSFEERQQMREKMKSQLEPVYAIAENHKDELAAIHDELKSEMMQNCPANCQGNCQRMGKGKGKGKGPGHGFKGKGNDSEMHDVHFLLMDPSGDSSFDETGLALQKDLNLYPNPASSELNIDFDLPDAGMVSIELLDKSGNVMQSIDNSERSKGKNSIRFNVDFLKHSEVYFIRVNMPGQSVVEKFVKL